MKFLSLPFIFGLKKLEKKGSKLKNEKYILEYSLIVEICIENGFNKFVYLNFLLNIWKYLTTKDHLKYVNYKNILNNQNCKNAPEP